MTPWLVRRLKTWFFLLGTWMLLRIALTFILVWYERRSFRQLLEVSAHDKKVSGSDFALWG